MNRDMMVGVVESYLQGLRVKDISAVPFAADVLLEGPFTGPIQGVEALTAYLLGLFPIVRDVRIQQHLVEQDQVCTRWDLHLREPDMVLPILEIFRISNGRIQELRPFYDTRPLFDPEE